MQTATASLGDARDDWKVVRALSEVLGAPLPYNSLEEVRRRLADVAPHLGRRDAVEPPLWLNGEYFKVGAAGRVPSLYSQLGCGRKQLGCRVSMFCEVC
jgi:NADH dehydrogenase (ubiquinone) Fe-S protein 1